MVGHRDSFPKHVKKINLDWRHIKCGPVLWKLLVCGFLVSCKFHYASGTVYTNVNSLFEAFSPYTLLKFFEFSDKGWNISENCLIDMYGYVEGLRTGALWAIKLYDASSYYGGAAFGASNRRLQSTELCRSLRLERRHQVLRVPWHMNTSAVPFGVHIISAHYLLEIAAEGKHRFEKIQQQICFPQSCTNADLRQILDVNFFQSNHIVRNNTYLKHRIVSGTFRFFEEIDINILIAFFCIPTLTYLTVHLLSVYIPVIKSVGWNRINLNGIVIDNDSQLGIETNVKFVLSPEMANHDNRPKIVTTSCLSVFEDYLHAISLSSVLYNLFQSDTEPLAGIYVTFTFLSIYAHITAEMTFMSNNNKTTPAQSEYFVLKYANYLPDIYFFVSGSKLALKFFQTLPYEKYCVAEQMKQVAKLVLQKLCCLTMSYTFCLYAEQVLDQYLHDNITMEIPSNDYSNCKNNKLANILYADTFFPISERCMPWTWFISLEVQFYIIACLILILVEIHTNYAVTMGVAIYVFSFLAASLWELSAVNEHQYSVSIEREISQFNLIFQNICLRITPYLLGICLGYILHRTQYNINLNVLLLFCGWIACSLCLGFFFFGFELLITSVNQWTRAVLVTLTHSIWSMILLWISLTSATEYGGFLKYIFSLKCANTLEKLSPICLLVTPVVIRLFVFTSDAPLYTSRPQVLLMTLGCIPIIFIASLLLYVLHDGPVCAAMEKALTQRK